MSSPSPQPSSPMAAGTSLASPASPDIPDREDSPDLPLTMSASLVLTNLPRDATSALNQALTSNAILPQPHEKIVVRFKPVGGSAPPLPARRELSRISATQRFEAVVTYLRKVLKVRGTESLFLYVNSTFAPALDEVVGNLHRCFKDSNDQLNVGYSMTPAFG